MDDDENQLKIEQLELKQAQQGFLDEEDLHELFMLLQDCVDTEDVGYCHKYDAMYCKETYEWLDEPCGCETCDKRPPRFPFMQVVVNNDRPKWKRK